MDRKKLKDLKKGDTVYFSIYGSESEEVKVKKVKVIDKAVHISIEPIRAKVYGTFFTGYYTSDIAIGLENGVIRTKNWYLDCIDKNLMRTETNDRKNFEASSVIRAIKTIRDYLRSDEDSI